MLTKWKSRKADEVDTSPGNGKCETAAGRCSLRAAVQEANALAGPDEIVLKGKVYMLTRVGTGENPAFLGDLDVTGDLTITGQGKSKTSINADKLDRVFHILGADVDITGVTIQSGYSTDFGGGIYNQMNRTLILENSTWITGNFATDDGGGIHNDGGTVNEAPDTVIRDNIPNNRN